MLGNLRFLKSFKLRTAVEMLTNLAVITAAVLFSVAVIKEYLVRHDSSNSEKRASRTEQAITPTGRRISLPGVDWSKSEGTIVLALKAGCRFCTDSASFYKKLAARQAANSGVGLIAVFPEELDSSKSYLSSIGVSIQDIRHSPLYSLGISGTPTVLLVDATGLVTNSWIGRLDPSREEQVLRQFD